jgi:pantothenate kinase-related protein Tda10
MYSEAIGLEAVAYCEKMVSQLDLDDLYEAHEEAIRLSKNKFAKYFSPS